MFLRVVNSLASFCGFNAVFLCAVYVIWIIKNVMAGNNKRYCNKWFSVAIYTCWKLNYKKRHLTEILKLENEQKIRCHIIQFSRILDAFYAQWRE